VELLNNGTLRASLHAETIPELSTMTSVKLLSEVLSIPLALLARYLVQRVSRDQSAAAGSRDAEG
jgi:hypothetical protein